MGKVMVVDDAHSERTLMESILKSAGHRVVSGTDGEGREDRMAEARPDVLLLDIVMPNRNSFPLDETTGFEFAAGEALPAEIRCLTLDDRGGADAESAAR